jgi:heme-degrading monooxygenase HmoA
MTGYKEAGMIARLWRAQTLPGKGESYFQYLEQTGLRDFARTEGFQGAFVLRREVGERSEYVILSLWRDLDAVCAFAGPDPDRAVYYPGDALYFPESDRLPLLSNFEVIHRPEADR